MLKVDSSLGTADQLGHESTADPASRRRDYTQQRECGMVEQRAGTVAARDRCDCDWCDRWTSQFAVVAVGPIERDEVVREVNTDAVDRGPVDRYDLAVGSRATRRWVVMSQLSVPAQSMDSCRTSAKVLR